MWLKAIKAAPELLEYFRDLALLKVKMDDDSRGRHNLASEIYDSLTEIKKDE